MHEQINHCVIRRPPEDYPLCFPKLNSVQSRNLPRWGNPPPAWKRWGNFAPRWGACFHCGDSRFKTVYCSCKVYLIWYKSHLMGLATNLFDWNWGLTFQCWRPVILVPIASVFFPLLSLHIWQNIPPFSFRSHEDLESQLTWNLAGFLPFFDPSISLSSSENSSTC